VATELDVLKTVSDLLGSAGIPYMLTGSFALAFYATPRMTRDLDIVVELIPTDAARVVDLFVRDFYIDPDDVRSAIASRRMFNLMHSASGIKIDLIVRKDSRYREVELSRRRRVQMGGIDTWIVSPEDLILSKLMWSLETESELQQRDIVSLAQGPIDRDYLRDWAAKLGVLNELERLVP